MANLKDEFGNIHPAIRACYSATVELYFHHDGKRYELGHLGPGFALLGNAQSIDATEGEIETIISGKVTRWPVRLTSLITGETKRFTFEGV